MSNLQGQEKMDGSAQVEREWIHPSSDFLFCSGPLQIGRCPSTLVRVTFTQSTHPNADLFWRHPHRHTQKSCLTAIWASLAQSSWHIKSTITWSKNTTHCFGENVELLLNWGYCNLRCWMFRVVIKTVYISWDFVELKKNIRKFGIEIGPSSKILTVS